MVVNVTLLVVVDTRTEAVVIDDTMLEDVEPATDDVVGVSVTSEADPKTDAVLDVTALPNTDGPDDPNTGVIVTELDPKIDATVVVASGTDKADCALVAVLKKDAAVLLAVVMVDSKAEDVPKTDAVVLNTLEGEENDESVVLGCDATAAPNIEEADDVAVVEGSEGVGVIDAVVTIVEDAANKIK